MPPSSLKVNEMFVAEISAGLNDDKTSSGLLSTLLHYSQSSTSPAVRLEALQVLKAVAHNYPTIMTLCWKQFSSFILSVLQGQDDKLWTHSWVNWGKRFNKCNQAAS